MDSGRTVDKSLSLGGLPLQNTVGSFDKVIPVSHHLSLVLSRYGQYTC